MPNKKINTTLAAVFVIAIFSASSSQGSMKTFEAPMDTSQWLFEGNPLGCKLTHDIPDFGKAEFDQQAGKDQTLAFRLGYKRHKIISDKVAKVRALAPPWLPLQHARELGEVDINPGSFLISSKNIASWRLLNELEVGRFPTFFYQDFQATEDQVAVALSTVGFKTPYSHFLDCMAQLIPYSLDELTQLTLYFDFDRANINTNDKPRLAALANYIKYDPSIELVFISGHTDSKGSRSFNQKLSQRRVASVKQSLQLDGVADSRFKTVSWGEKKPAATNRNAQGRAKNRRVYIRLAQN